MLIDRTFWVFGNKIHKNWTVLQNLDIFSSRYTVKTLCGFIMQRWTSESRTSCDVLVHWLFSFNQAYKNEWMGLIKIYGFPLRHPQQVMAFMNPHEYLKLATKRNNPRLTHYYKPHMSHTMWSQYEPQFLVVTKAGPFGRSPGLHTFGSILYRIWNGKSEDMHNSQCMIFWLLW